MINIELGIKDRLKLIEVLPEKGTFEKLIIKQALHDKIAIQQNDVQKYSINEINNRLEWKKIDGSDIEKYELTELEFTYIKSILKDLNEKELLTTDLLDIYKQVL
jgi:hypothetical protein